MTEAELVTALLRHCPPLNPEPRMGFDGQYDGATDPARNDRASISHQEALILATFADGKRVLEIGTGLGVSTVALACHARYVVSIDPNQWVRDSIKAPQNVSLLASIDMAIGPFDVAFIDGLHTFDAVCKDIEDALKLVKPGGAIAFHDVIQGDVRAAVTSFPWAYETRHETVGLLTECGVPA